MSKTAISYRRELSPLWLCTVHAHGLFQTSKSIASLVSVEQDLMCPLVCLFTPLDEWWLNGKQIRISSLNKFNKKDGYRQRNVRQFGQSV